MLLFRSFAIGLSAACFALLVLRPAVVVQVTRPTPPPDQLSLFVPPVPSFMAGPPALTAAEIPTIVDVAPGMTAAQIAATVRLQPGEQITTVDDAPVGNDLGAGILLANRGLYAHQFIDFGVTGPHGDRRVLVLLH